MRILFHFVAKRRPVAFPAPRKCGAVKPQSPGPVPAATVADPPMRGRDAQPTISAVRARRSGLQSPKRSSCSLAPVSASDDAFRLAARHDGQVALLHTSLTPFIFLIFAATRARLSATLVARPFMTHVIDGRRSRCMCAGGVGFLNSSAEHGGPHHDAAVDHHRAAAAARSGGRSAHAAQKAASAGGPVLPARCGA